MSNEPAGLEEDRREAARDRPIVLAVSPVDYLTGVREMLGDGHSSGGGRLGRADEEGRHGRWPQFVRLSH